ncbi:MAG: hypothetical protein RR472_03640 [Anaerovoracaceae bacterium]
MDETKKLYERIQREFAALVKENQFALKEIRIRSKGLTPKEAIGITKRQDYPILTGGEIMLQAECEGCLGQAFTSAPADFTGSLEEIMALDIVENPHNRGIYIATMNGVLRYLGKTENTVHCKDDGPVDCAKQIGEKIKKDHKGKRIALVGYQPSIMEALAVDVPLRVLDLNSENVGEVRFGVVVEHGIRDFEAVVVLCTGSVLCNGTLTPYLNLKKPVLFFGTTIAGTATLLGLNRICPKST